jgi:hypothetical protein
VLNQEGRGFVNAAGANAVVSGVVHVGYYLTGMTLRLHLSA